MCFSFTDSAVEVEAKFDHNLKKRKRKKKRMNLSLNQSRRKKKKISYGQQVNSGQSSKSRYEPHKGNFNFTVPDEKVLRKSKTGLPNVIGCGIIEDSVKLLDKDKDEEDLFFSIHFPMRGS